MGIVMPPIDYRTSVPNVNETPPVKEEKHWWDEIKKGVKKTLSIEAYADALRPLAKELKQKLTVPVEVVHQCTDIERFYPPTEKEKEQNHQELLFVGNSRGIYRKILKDLLPTKYDLKVIGGGWKGLIPQKYWESSYLDNKELSKHYGSADILLNDHWDDMCEKGFVSNRVYDGLASGAFIISDKVRDMGGIKDYICLYETAAELAELIDHHLNNSEERRKKSDEALAYIQENHTFDNRAKQFSKLIKVLS